MWKKCGKSGSFHIMQNIDATVIAKLADPMTLSAVEKRYWIKVTVINDDDSCWEWNAGRYDIKNANYGKFNFVNPETGKRSSTPAQRVAFYLTHGHMPHVARHACDNPPCCRPSHIRDGSQADNIADMDERGRRGEARYQDGEANSIAVLTEDLVRLARLRYTNGEAMEWLAMDLGVSPTAMYLALRGDTWKHITDVPPVTMRSPGGKLTAAQVEEARAARATGESCSSIAARMGCTPSNISYLTRDKTVAKKLRIRQNLTDDQIRQIRNAHGRGMTYQTIADAHGISKGLVNHIAHGRAYAHVSS
jgi:hypothetical protein